jgi:hypothetical protein
MDARKICPECGGFLYKCEHYGHIKSQGGYPPSDWTPSVDELKYAAEEMERLYKEQRSRVEKMTIVIHRVLDTVSYVEAGTWRISSDNIQLLKEAIKEK